MVDANCISTIDWTATGTMLQGIGTLLGALAVIVAAFIGDTTLKRWRQQKLAERHIEQAERILTATYNVRRALSYVRNPALWPYEFAAAEEQLKESGEWQKAVGEQEQRSLATAKLYYNRLNRTRDELKALQECLPMARALFGEKLEKAIETLNHQFWTVEVYVGAQHRDKSGADQEFRNKIERALWEGYPSADKNEVDQTIAEQVKIIEDECVPVLRLAVSKAKK